MPWVSDELIERAREIDLLSYMQAYEPFELKRDGPNRYVTETHGSLVILRYPKDKTDITGIIYEPWHFRYVGIEAAAEIMESGICLEEY